MGFGVRRIRCMTILVDLCFGDWCTWLGCSRCCGCWCFLFVYALGIGYVSSVKLIDLSIGISIVDIWIGAVLGLLACLISAIFTWQAATHECKCCSPSPPWNHHRTVSFEGVMATPNYHGHYPTRYDMPTCPRLQGTIRTICRDPPTRRLANRSTDNPR